MKMKIFYSVLCLMAIIYVKETFLTDFTTEQQLTLCLLAFAVYLWVAAPIPTGPTSILLLACMLIFNLVDSVEDALVGFLSPALYFILLLSLISYSLVQVGVDKIIARFLIKMSKGGPTLIVIMLPLFILVLPIILPSAIARFKMLLPIITKLNQYYGFPEKSLFEKYSLYVIGMLNQKATMIIFTGGGFPILASQLLKDYEIAEVGWMDWFLHIGPPLWIGSIIVAIFVWQFLKKMSPNDEWYNERKPIDFVDQKEDRMPPAFWVVIISFLLMIMTWIVTDQGKVPLVLPPMILVVLYSLPKLGLITNKVIRDYDWENFLLLGSSFSLGMLMAENGTASVLARELISFVSPDEGMTVKIIAISLLIFLLRFLFVVPSSAMIVIFPIVISYSELIGVQPEKLAFLVIMIIGGVVVLPIHSPTVYMAYETGIFKKKEQYIIGVSSSIIIMIIAILASLYYW
ncbi:SLC13 family permease [Virgibacillus necropolis]|uniref:Sodium:sulfate symporter n=1 Tax=Virgibacillus necropolis TaxID=163877 RepID=A0A221MAI3_9BACI|nr:SLC13 family permease [Virgibacillus necropolis]ASN04655.1 hypothetical protein CFK40_06300 [Virgibacillus necropolis]